jgi:hypothetical protein
MMKYQKMVDGALNLADLANILNTIGDELDDITIDQVVDVCNLPVYGGNDPKNTSEVWSWDAENILVDNNGQNKWGLMKRCPICGEAPFHCKH